MSEPLGYRILARRLARDLERCVAANDFACAQHGPRIDEHEFKRRFAQAKRTLSRFAAYEHTQKGRGRR